MSTLAGNRDRPLRVLVDLTRLWAGGIGGGIKPALLEMLRWLQRQPGEPFEFVFLANADTRAEVERLARAGDRVVDGASAPADTAAREECVVTYCPFGFTNWACPGIPTISLIVDLLHRDFPETLSPEERRHREEAAQETVARADLFQVISDFTARRLQSHYAVSPDRILRTYLPIHGRLSVPPSPAKRRNFFFYPANPWAHKNHDTLLAAFALYRRQTTPDPWTLVLCGFHGPAEQRWREAAAKSGIADAVEFLGYVDDPTLAQLWSTAGALVFPSLHEGFGIPVLEAMAQGVPVVADRSTVVPEIAGEAALLVDARRPEELAAAMGKLSGDAGLRERLAGLGRQRAAHFQIDEEFGRLARALKSAAAGPARFRRLGYHPVDGLLESLSSFALPGAESMLELDYEFAPLGVLRTVEFWIGRNQLARIEVPADSPVAGRLAIPPGARSLSLRVPNASKLSATDPRTHGVLVRRLLVKTGSGVDIDLLG